MMGVKITDLGDGNELFEYDSGSSYVRGKGGLHQWLTSSGGGKPKDLAGTSGGMKASADHRKWIAQAQASDGKLGPGWNAETGAWEGSLTPGTTPTAGTGGGYSSGGGGYSGGGGGYSGGDMGGGLVGQIADAYSQPLDFSSLPGLSGVSGPSQSVDFTDAFDPRFQNVNFLDPFDSRLQGVSFGGGTQGVDFSGGGPSVATLDWNEPSGNPGGSGGGKGGQAMAPPPMMQQPPMQQAPPMQGGGKGAGKGGAAAQPQPFGRLYG